ncbi:MAG: response regulator [Candidatus Aenigmarchaeota archaeon]|nr:response regulator [Candidatus Aenigmarchaeota archaeon]
MEEKKKKDKKRILIVEDDPYICKMYQLKLELQGFIIDIAINGKIGVEKVKEKKPDLVLLDILMPEMDGFEVMKVLKSDSQTKDIPIVVLSNVAQDERIKKALSLGAKSYIIKTQFTPAQVVQKINETLGLSV